MKCVECNNREGNTRTMGMCYLCWENQDWLWVLSEEKEEA